MERLKRFRLRSILMTAFNYLESQGTFDRRSLYFLKLKGVLKQPEKKGVDMEMCKPTVRPEEAKCDCHLVQHGYKCSGKLWNYPLYLRRGVFERLWLWEKEGSSPVVTVDTGNHFCRVVPFKVAVDPVAYDEWACSYKL